MGELKAERPAQEPTVRAPTERSLGSLQALRKTC